MCVYIYIHISRNELELLSRKRVLCVRVYVYIYIYALFCVYNDYNKINKEVITRGAAFFSAKP